MWVYLCKKRSDPKYGRVLLEEKKNCEDIESGNIFQDIARHRVCKNRPEDLYRRYSVTGQVMVLPYGRRLL